MGDRLTNEAILFEWITKGTHPLRWTTITRPLHLILAMRTPRPRRPQRSLARIIETNRKLTWEMVPSEMLDKPDGLGEHLTQDMPMMALAPEPGDTHPGGRDRPDGQRGASVTRLRGIGNPTVEDYAQDPSHCSYLIGSTGHTERARECAVRTPGFAGSPGDRRSRCRLWPLVLAGPADQQAAIPWASTCLARWLAARSPASPD